MIYTASLADAIVAVLQAHGWGTGVTIARKRLVTQTLEAMDGTAVSVIPFGAKRTNDSVGVQKIDHDVRIVVQRKLAGGPDDAEADAVGILADDMAALLVGEVILGCECESVSLTPTYDAKQLHSLDVFDVMIHTSWTLYEDGPEA